MLKSLDYSLDKTIISLINPTMGNPFMGNTPLDNPSLDNPPFGNVPLVSEKGDEAIGWRSHHCSFFQWLEQQGG